MLVSSTSGVELATHDLGGTGTTLLISHATGFHGRCYWPIATLLADTFHSMAFDYRGHGDTARPEGGIDWQRYGDDAFAMATRLTQTIGEPIVAFGHSMGGASLLMAAHRDPTLFRRIIAFEPIVFPPPNVAADDNPESMLVAAARRRRTTFPSYEEAIAHYSSKPPLNAFTADALAAYVRHGFISDPDGTIHLKCLPATEADTFAGGGLHGTWDRLPEIATEVLVVGGRPEGIGPATIAGRIAERLPNGRYLRRDDLDHFGPMTHPAECAEIIRAEMKR
ncbi:MAG: alpha/beta hydrolase [Actinobacteria bacterium]|nr:alpha/beta hydrolase [Actinomycetota bacterium]